MTSTLLQRVPGSALRVNSPVKALLRAPESWIVSTDEGPEHFDAIILATPTHGAAQLLAASSPGLAAELAAIPYTSSITVALGYGPDVRRSLPPGFGFLVPRSEGKRLLAATFVHNKFPYRAAQNRALLRCFIAGEKAADSNSLSDEQIVGAVREELGQILRLRAPALFARIYRWKSAMAQYTVGHLERLERIKKLQHELAGLALAGNGYRGIGIPDCIRSGQEAAKQVSA